MHAEPFVTTPSDLAEGPLWLDSQLYWVDITGKKLCATDATGKTLRVWNFDHPVTTVCIHKDDGLLLAGVEEIFRFFPETNTSEPLAVIHRETEKSRCNDGKIDPAGRLWIGTLTAPDKHAGGLYRMDHDGSVSRILDGITISNGLAWSADHRTMYYIDSPTREVVAFDFDIATSDISNRRAIITVPAEWGVPDGMTIDRDGNLWVAIWGASKVVCWNPANGKIVAEIALPCSQVTSCCFGEDNLLYITTAKVGLETPEPLAGCIFKCATNTQGFEPFRFGK